MEIEKGTQFYKLYMNMLNQHGLPEHEHDVLDKVVESIQEDSDSLKWLVFNIYNLGKMRGSGKVPDEDLLAVANEIATGTNSQVISEEKKHIAGNDMALA